MNANLKKSLLIPALAFLLSAPALAQDNYCGITPQSARSIAFEVIKQTGYAYDSVSSAYYVSVLASRLSPFYVVFFYLKGIVVGEMEVDMCGRQGTPHPGLQYLADSEVKASQLILEPDLAFATLKAKTGKSAAFASRVFPYGLTASTEELNAIDFWWFLLDEEGTWHYLTKLGEPCQPHPK
jgi:hypothetical protein